MRFLETAQWQSGQSIEDFLDRYFTSDGWHIERTTPQQERRECLGDRIFSRDGERYFVEYKSGIQTFYTGNVFLETISVDSQNVPGWVYSCRADYILYAAILNGVILVFIPDRLRELIDSLRAQFREVKTSNGQNMGYDTHGVIVPLEYAKQQVASKVIELPDIKDAA